MSKNSIALILPYYGDFPPYFSCYLKTLSDKLLDVLLFTDNDCSKFDRPNNLRIIRMSFETLGLLARQKLQTAVVLPSPKKLCDLKPMYGRIFEDYLQGYEYWAFGDCDLFYGARFNEFLSRIVSGAWDAVSARRAWLSGPFAAFRNTEKMRRLYERATNWREILADGRNFIWDECGGEYHGELQSGAMTMEDCAKICDNFASLIWRTKDIVFFHEDDILTEDALKQSVVRMRHGRLFLEGKEIYVFHCIIVKHRKYFRFSNGEVSPSGDFEIDDTGLYITRFERVFRPYIGFWRRCSAAVLSLRHNGIGRIFW